PKRVGAAPARAPGDQQAQHADAADPGRVYSRARHRGRDRLARSAADPRGGGDDRVVGSLLSRALCAAVAPPGRSIVSVQASRLLFWLGLLLVVIVALGLVQSILMPFATGLAIAYILAPGVRRLET